MSKGEADWEEIKKTVEIKNRVSPKTLIIGNGDVKSYIEVLEKSEKYGVDGVMIGRGVFANPWVFSKNSIDHTKNDYIDLLKKHIDLFEKTWGETKNFAIIKKFFKMYVKDFKGASELRVKLMDTKNFTEVRKLID
jgi:tRNA-dihydrouridine synthase